MRIVIEIDGGCVSAIYADQKDVEAYVVDRDSNDGSGHPLDAEIDGEPVRLWKEIVETDQPRVRQIADTWNITF